MVRVRVMFEPLSGVVIVIRVRVMFEPLSGVVIVGFTQVSDGSTTACHRSFFDSTTPSVTSPVTVDDVIEVCGRHCVSPGSYLVVPATSNVDVDADFLLRIFTKTSSRLAYVFIFLTVLM